MQGGFFHLFLSREATKHRKSLKHPLYQLTSGLRQLTGAFHRLVESTCKKIQGIC